uniref:Retrovirus-related Pol polyprotein from transposon TNT 1-94 n=1 Tax=Tanacetum cinerariifolium TaxID=118510 RepID=A0A699HW56_TANCI|nr:retrovirus-related Pol polyprotein from transposon TNT 1-94 [Tanacetum cinerariifolium]
MLVWAGKFGFGLFNRVILVLVRVLHRSSNTNQNPENIDFVSLNSISSINEADTTASGVKTTHTQGITVNSISVNNLSDDVICAFLASHPNSPQLAKEDLEQIDPECRASKNQDNRGREYGRKIVPVETPTENALIAQDGIGGYDWSYQAKEEIPTNYAFMALTSSGSSLSSESELLWNFIRVKMSRDVITVGSIMRIPLLYRGEYSQWHERFMNYLEEQTYGEAMINSIQNGDQSLPVIAQVSLAGNAHNAPPTLKDPKFWTAEEKKTRKIDHRKAATLYEYETFKAIEGEQLLDTYLRYLQVINDLKKCGHKKDNCDVNVSLGYKKKAVVVTSDPLALVAEKMKVSKRKEKAVVSSDSKEVSPNKKQEFVKSDDKKVKKKDDEKKRDMSKVKCYNCKKEGHFAKDCKKVKDQAWMESSSDSDQEINANMVFMAQIEKVLSESDESSSSAEETIVEKRIEKANQQSKDLENQNKVLKEKYDVLINQVNTIEEKNNDFNEQIKVLNEKNADLLAQTEVLKDQLKVKHVMIDTYTECQAQYAKLKEERYEYIIRYSALYNNDKQHRKKIDEQEILFSDQVENSKVIALGMFKLRCSKHMTGNRALLKNFVKKFLGTVRFGNNDFAMIAGYGDVVIGSMTIKKFYYVEGLGHNLFSVGQFCDKGLEVAFQKSTCFVRNEDGVDLLIGDRSLNLYTIALNEVASNSSTCLLAKASSLQFWLWHQLLSYLNFAAINNLVKNNLVQGLPKMKFEKDHLCSAFEQGKIHRKHHKSKTAFCFKQATLSSSHGFVSFDAH